MQQVEIIVKEEVDMQWADWLGGLTITRTGDRQTRLCGELPDQAALYGLLSRLRDLGLTLVLVRSRDAGPAAATGGGKYDPDIGSQQPGQEIW